MKICKEVINAIEAFEENSVIFATRVYSNGFEGRVKKATFYKTIGRMCEAGNLLMIGKAVYCRPKKDEDGEIIPMTTDDILRVFIENNQGVVVGDALYYNLGLSPKEPGRVVVYSSNLDWRYKNIQEVLALNVPFEFTPEAVKMIQILEVLQNYDKIEDLDYNVLLELCESVVKDYDEDLFEDILKHIKYFKATISFLREILEFHCVKNNLKKHLTHASYFVHPSMRELMEKAEQQKAEREKKA